MKTSLDARGLACQFNIGDIAPMLIAHRASSFLAARRNRYMTSSHTHETISA